MEQFFFTASHSTAIILRFDPVETKSAKELYCQQRLLKQLLFIVRIEVKKEENGDVEKEEEFEEIR
jgi:hypothetical protein